MSETTTIRVGARPAALGALGTFFDGESAEARAARLRIDEAQQSLVIETDFDTTFWPLKEIRRVPDQAGKDGFVLALNGHTTARLIADEDRILKRCPNLNWRISTVKRGRILLWAMASIASVAAIIFFLVPLMANQLAGFIPPAGEKALGDTTLRQIRQAMDRTDTGPVAICENPDGLAALEVMTDKLQANTELPVGLTVTVLDHSMVNAFALPGGHVVLFEGLIRTAQSPEELASVIAHEIGHVVSRDPTRHALRSAGSIGVLGLLFGDFAGGAIVLLMTEQLIEAQYSQAAERAADAFAMDLLTASSVSPGALGEMFKRFQTVGSSDGNVFSHFSSHPETEDRIEQSRLRAVIAQGRGFEEKPIILQDQWQELRAICD